MATQKAPTDFKVRIHDILGNVYISDSINVREYVTEHHTNSANIPPDQLWSYTKNNLKFRMGFVNQNQELCVKVKGVETMFNPSHVISIEFVTE